MAEPNVAVDGIDWMRVLAASGVVLMMLGILAMGLRYWTIHKGGFGLNMTKGQKRRLRMVESLTVDSKRRLVIVRCDDHEHLLLLGVERDMVVSSAVMPRQNKA